MSELYSTSDIWLGAYFLTESNAQLKDVQVNRNGREGVSFSFQGEELTQLAKTYCQEQALANVIQLRTKINFLRDIIFQSKKK